MANWSKMKREILIGSLSGLNFAIRNMNYSQFQRIIFQNIAQKQKSFFPSNLPENLFHIRTFPENGSLVQQNFKSTMIRISLSNYLVRSMLGNVLANLWSSPTSPSINLPKKKTKSSQYGDNSSNYVLSTQSKALNYGAFRQSV